MKTYLWISCNEDGEVYVHTFITADIQQLIQDFFGQPLEEVKSKFLQSWPGHDPQYWPKGRNHLLVEVVKIVHHE